MKSPYALLRPSGLQELCLWTIPAPSVWTPPSPWWCRRSIPGCRSSYRDCGQSQLLHHHHRDRHRRAQPAFTHPSMVASTYQAVSGAGVAGIGELHDQISALEAGRTPTVSAFPHQIAYNLIPQIGGTQYEGYTSEEMKMQNEGRRLLHLPDLTVSCTCVRVPVIRSHSISATLRFDRPIFVEEAREAIAAAPGCRLMDRADEGYYPMPLEASDQDLVLWDAFARTYRPQRACASGAAGIKSAGAPPPTPCRLRSSSSRPAKAGGKDYRKSRLTPAAMSRMSAMVEMWEIFSL